MVNAYLSITYLPGVIGDIKQYTTTYKAESELKWKGEKGAVCVSVRMHDT